MKRIIDIINIDFGNPVCNIIKKDDLLQGNYGRVSYFGIRIQDELREYDIDWQEKPRGIYASTYHKGSYDTMHVSYERLLKAIYDEGYTIYGNAYEIDLFSTLTSLDKDEYMKQISIQVYRG